MRLLYPFLAAVLLLLLTATGGLAGMAQFAGSWTNVDANTAGITNLDIAVMGNNAQVQAWGKCHPTDCDWGTVQAQAFAPDVSSDILSGADTLIAVFDAGFSETTLVIKPAGNRLKVDSYDRFKDNSGRSNYLASYTFQKGQAPGGTTPGGSTPGDMGPGDVGPGGTIPGSTPALIDLTGVWNCDDGGIYYVRQLGSTVWWYGELDPNAPNWSNVMRGAISGNMINADWSDVPKGSVMQNGNLVLQIASNNKLVAISKTGGFGGSVWTR
ncbi:MAG: hypothetical protein M0Q13_10935 [Methanothrix sp.]|jgi:hypothetical protein|nr:hypothetical protein [Methanothrix sp.]